jgi:hypothetical protein
VVGGFGLVAMWYVSGALGLPRRYAVQPAGTEGYSLAGAVFGLVFAAGFLVVLADLASLARRAFGQQGAVAAGAGDEDDGELPHAVEPDADDVPLRSLPQVVAATAVAVLALISLLPSVNDAIGDDVRWHHIQHAVAFSVGALLGLVLGSAPQTARRVGAHLPGVALTLVVVAPALLMLFMVPAVYQDLEDDGALHLLYHVAVIALGVLAGLGAARLGRLTGRLVALLAIAMPLLYAAGVTGT